jgi:hypothetical protein
LAFTIGPYTLAGGQEATFSYWWGPDAAPIYQGPKAANPAPRLQAGGSFSATGQGVRNIGTDVDQRIVYHVRVKNFGGTGSFYLRGGDLT